MRFVCRQRLPLFPSEYAAALRRAKPGTDEGGKERDAVRERPRMRGEGEENYKGKKMREMEEKRRERKERGREVPWPQGPSRDPPSGAETPDPSRHGALPSRPALRGTEKVLWPPNLLISSPPFLLLPPPRAGVHGVSMTFPSALLASRSHENDSSQSSLNWTLFRFLSSILGILSSAFTRRCSAFACDFLFSTSSYNSTRLAYFTPIVGSAFPPARVRAS